ncbi:hypothetical protein EC988_001419 [Linderina pennispora]|nr:hypothetical protein EC988_001419 [Linderina pennispora]
MSVPTTTALPPFAYHNTHYPSAAMHRRNSASASPEHQPRGASTNNTQTAAFPPAQQHLRYEQYRRDEPEYGRPIQQHPGSFGGPQRLQPPMHGRIAGQPSMPGYHVQQSPPQQMAASAARPQYQYMQQQPPQQQQQQQQQATRTGASSAAAKPPSHHPAATHASSSSSSSSHLHRPYDLHSPATSSRTFWNHYETSLLVQLWLEFEPQFMANKRNAGVWAQLAERLTERSGRHRTVRECRIKWKNMWAKHRDLANATHMSWDAKLREFPHYSEFVEIKQRSSMQSSNE